MSNRVYANTAILMGNSRFTCPKIRPFKSFCGSTMAGGGLASVWVTSASRLKVAVRSFSLTAGSGGHNLHHRLDGAARAGNLRRPVGLLSDERHRYRRAWILGRAVLGWLFGIMHAYAEVPFQQAPRRAA
jgi:hypothetical protein